ADSSIDRRSPNAPESLLFGKPIPEVPELVRQANPLTYIDQDDPPFLVQHGIADRVVPVNQSDVLVEALKQAGVPVEYHRIEGAGHGFQGLSKEKIGEEYGAALKFFIDRLSGGKPPRQG
ncbi:MAG: prolyl oligopeptidase family serine peptidase, partial [Armatimonadetes bacterium]|nr:prolyl oligopeptidase family serine peptidase [Armatimonadota bacterium]